MSVFSRGRQAQRALQKNLPVQLDEVKCRGSHKWGGIVPQVDPDLHEIQNAHLIGKRCDCGNLLYATESLCGCPNNKYWKIYFE